MVPTVERIQTGVRMERRLLKVLKGLAEYLDMSLGDLLEGIVLHAFERRQPFGDETVAVIGQLSKVYGLDLTAANSHRLLDSAAEQHDRGAEQHDRGADVHDRGAEQRR
jgi:hypothetical protein